MAVSRVIKRIYRDGTIKYHPEGQKKPDTAATLERDDLIKKESDGIAVTFTLLDANNIRVVCWQLGANANSRAKGLGETFPGISARLLDVVDYKNRRRHSSASQGAPPDSSFTFRPRTRILVAFFFG